MKCFYNSLLFLASASMVAACGQGSNSSSGPAATTGQAAAPKAPGTTTASDTAGLGKKTDWWKETVVYQLYPRSFQTVTATE